MRGGVWHSISYNKGSRRIGYRRIAEEKLSAIHGLLEVMMEPLSRSLAMAPLDDEELRQEMAESIQRSSESLARGEGVSHEEISREFGLAVSERV